jgi:hypothetical protein
VTRAVAINTRTGDREVFNTLDELGDWFTTPGNTGGDVWRISTLDNTDIEHQLIRVAGPSD